MPTSEKKSQGASRLQKPQATASTSERRRDPNRSSRAFAVVADSKDNGHTTRSLSRSRVKEERRIPENKNYVSSRPGNRDDAAVLNTSMPNFVGNRSTKQTKPNETRRREPNNMNKKIVNKVEERSANAPTTKRREPVKRSTKDTNNGTVAKPDRFKADDRKYNNSRTRSTMQSEDRKRNMNVKPMVSQSTRGARKINENGKEKVTKVEDKHRSKSAVEVLSVTLPEPRKTTKNASNENEAAAAIANDDDYNEYDYQDDFEDYESDFESDADDDEEKSELPRDSQESDDDEGISEKEIVMSAHSLGRRHSITLTMDNNRNSLTDESSLNKYERQMLMNALKEENKSVMEHQHRLRAGKQKSLDNLSSSVHNSEISPSDSLREQHFINFFSAKSRQSALKGLGKTLTRKQELIDNHRILLNDVDFSLFELPPIDYDFYISCYGKSNAKQACSQTNEDDLHEEIQTDELDMKDKWTQEPAHDFLGVGGDMDDELDQKKLEKIVKTDNAKLCNFIHRAGEAIIDLLETNEIYNMTRTKATKHQNNQFSEEHFELGKLPFKKDAPVTFVQFSSSEAHILLTVHGADSSQNDSILQNYGLICIWNIHQPSLPQKNLICSSQPHCACFSPGKANCVFAGLVDGSIVVWDLTEASNKHKRIQIDQQEIVLRIPTYNTAEILHEESHRSSVISIATKQINSESFGDLLTKNSTTTVASLEEYGTVMIWAVVEIPHPDPSGNDSDLGLAPGSGIRLIRNSVICLSQIPGIPSISKRTIQAFELQFVHDNQDTLLVATDTGFVVHCNNQGYKMVPAVFTPDTNVDSAVHTMAVATGHPLFLVGSSDGSLRMHTLKKRKPLMEWPSSTSGKDVKKIVWCKNGYSQYYILDSSSRIYLWNLEKNQWHPTVTETFSNGQVLSLHLNNETNGGSSSNELFMAISFSSGVVEIHKILEQVPSHDNENLKELLQIS